MEKKSVKKEYKLNKRRIISDYRKARRDLREAYFSDLAKCNEEVGKRIPINPPKRPLLEEIGNAVSHGVGALFAIVALVLLCIASDRPREYVGASLYCFGLFAMFLMSCLYHSFLNGGKTKRLFRRFDYSGIYLLIGATFAPIILCYSQSKLSILFLVIQWAIIAFGITFIGIFGPVSLKGMHVALYVALGWVGVLFIPEMIVRQDYSLLAFILGGGVVYSIGIIPFALDKKAAHFIWHLFVLCGAILQWIGIYVNIYLN